MKTDFFYKKAKGWFGVFLSIVFMFGVLYIIGTTFCAASLETEKVFYFLTSTSSHIQASTHNAQYLGGAGFILKNDQREYVTYAVYTEESLAKQAYKSLKEQEEEICVLTIRAKNARILSKNQKKHATVYESALCCLSAHIQLLNDEISRLESGATQESTKRFLDIQMKQFSYMEKTYQKQFAAFATVCQESLTLMKEMHSTIVYVKDMRYLLCFLCQNYVDLVNGLHLK